MKVIVAGYPKTGTKTLCVALRKLGYNVYDFLENITFLGEEWVTIFRDGWTTEDFRKMYEDVDAVTGLPCSYFWEELHKAFPEAKIILMTRDEVSWYKSASNHLRATEESITLRLVSLLSSTAWIPYGVLYSCYMGPVIFGSSDILRLWMPFRSPVQIPGIMKMKYRAHNAYVIQNAPPEKLLMFECSQGWEPLCNFLGAPVPDEPFPHKNKSGNVMKVLFETYPIQLKMQKEMMMSLAIIGSAVSVGGILLITVGPRTIWNSTINTFWGLAQKIGFLDSK